MAGEGMEVAPGVELLRLILESFCRFHTSSILVVADKDAILV
jgi:hypothetical protein